MRTPRTLPVAPLCGGSTVQYVHITHVWRKYCRANNARGLSGIGWGGRIRTSEWRDQNPLPYHLATPQIQQLDADSPRTVNTCHRASTRAAAARAAGSSAKDANTQPPVPV